MLSRILRQFLFSLIHLVISVLVAVQNVYHRYCVNKCFIPNHEVTKQDLALILKYVPRLNKTPKHLVFLADTENHELADLGRLIIWSLVAGIPYVSFHDITGHLKENDEKLFLEVERSKKGIPGCIKWSNKPDLNGYTNGIPAHTIVVNIFTREDGAPRIAECIKKIAEGEIECKSDIEDFTAQELDSILSTVYPPIPEPDLFIYTGERCCTHGLLPWHIRLTEFLQVSPVHYVDIYDYVGALCRYSNCDQRFGK